MFYHIYNSELGNEYCEYNTGWITPDDIETCIATVERMLKEEYDYLVEKGILGVSREDLKITITYVDWCDDIETFEWHLVLCKQLIEE